MPIYAHVAICHYKKPKMKKIGRGKPILLRRNIKNHQNRLHSLTSKDSPPWVGALCCSSHCASFCFLKSGATLLKKRRQNMFVPETRLLYNYFSGDVNRKQHSAHYVIPTTVSNTCPASLVVKHQLCNPYVGCSNPPLPVFGFTQRR